MFGSSAKRKTRWILITDGHCLWILDNDQHGNIWSSCVSSTWLWPRLRGVGQSHGFTVPSIWYDFWTCWLPCVSQYQKLEPITSRKHIYMWYIYIGIDIDFIYDDWLFPLFTNHWPKHLHFHVPQSCRLAPPRLALLIIAVEMMAGCWLVEQPGNSILRFHPRVMDVFFQLRVAWLATNEV